MGSDEKGDGRYYPFGLTMAGISDKALKSQYAENKIRFQKQEFQNDEFSDGSGLETYEFKYRFDDPQTGRFWQIDPLSNKYVSNSTYAFSENKVTSSVELEGLESAPLGYGWYPGITKEQADEIPEGLRRSHNDGMRAAVDAGIIMIMIANPEVGAPLAISRITGLPVSPAPQALEGVVADESLSVMDQAVSDAAKVAPVDLPNASTSESLTAQFTLESAPESQLSPGAGSANGTSKYKTLEPGPFADGSIPARGKGQTFTQAERDKVNDIGYTSGCHTCGTKDPGTKSGNFVPDHQPVSATVPDGTPQNLYPQCIGCSKTQGGEIRQFIRVQQLSLKSNEPQRH